MSYYSPCDGCGASLDPEERCDCRKKTTVNPEPSEFDKLFDEIAEEYMRAG